MVPGWVLAQAAELGLDILAVTDHNTVANIGAFQRAAEDTGITVLAGMELQTREEVHLVCLFDSLVDGGGWEAEVRQHLPELKNDERYFGEQWLVDEYDEVIDKETRLLLVSTDLSVEDAVEGVARHGGVVIPAHVDRPAYSIIANLGFVPPDLDIAGVELSPRITPAEALARFPQLAGLSMVASSDAHYLGDMRARNTLRMAAPTVDELAKALAYQDGREMWIDGRRVPGR
jgi:3',5'-nucleoside bisphosphate phosphatase